MAGLWPGELPSGSLLAALPFCACTDFFEQAQVPLGLCVVSMFPHSQTPQQKGWIKQM